MKVLLGIILGGLLWGSVQVCADTPSLEKKLTEAFRNSLGQRADRSQASLLVHSDKLGLHLLLRNRPTGEEAFHIASVGKLFTTALIARLIDQGKLSWDDRVAPLLAPGTLDGLFVVAGTDHQSEVTIAQLLSHTSGVADYFADPPSGKVSGFALLYREPETHWTPQRMLEFTRTQLKPVALPGQVFHYSDTGFVLLGLIIERLTGMSFDEALRREILVPLEMTRTWMPFRSHPTIGPETLRPAFIEGHDVSRFPSMTADWAGGGIASTEADLLTFARAFHDGRLFSKQTLDRLETFDHSFQTGIHYGMGLMEYRWGEYFFALDSYPRLIGHMGVLGTQLFYDPIHDLHFVLSLGTDQGMEDGVRLIIDLLSTIEFETAPAAKVRSSNAVGAALTLPESFDLGSSGYALALRNFTMSNPESPTGLYLGYLNGTIAHTAGNVLIADLKPVTVGWMQELPGGIALDASVAVTLGTRTQGFTLFDGTYVGISPTLGVSFPLFPGLDGEVSAEPTFSVAAFGNQPSAPNKTVWDFYFWFVSRSLVQQKTLDYR